jgi:hypothetical protein
MNLFDKNPLTGRSDFLDSFLFPVLIGLAFLAFLFLLLKARSL